MYASSSSSSSTYFHTPQGMAYWVRRGRDEQEERNRKKYHKWQKQYDSNESLFEERNLLTSSSRLPKLTTIWKWWQCIVLSDGKHIILMCAGDGISSGMHWYGAGCEWGCFIPGLQQIAGDPNTDECIRNASIM